MLLTFAALRGLGGLEHVHNLLPRNPRTRLLAEKVVKAESAVIKADAPGKDGVDPNRIARAGSVLEDAAASRNSAGRLS
jgi:hypothetical protein